MKEIVEPLNIDVLQAMAKYDIPNRSMLRLTIYMPKIEYTRLMVLQRPLPPLPATVQSMEDGENDQIIWWYTTNHVGGMQKAIYRVTEYLKDIPGARWKAERVYS